MMDESSDLIALATHEAGHAVIGRVLGLSCGRMTIVAEADENLGHSVMADPRYSWERGDGPRRKEAEKFALGLYAGAEAERVLLGLNTELDTVDRQRAIKTLAWAGVRGASFFDDEHYDRAEARLRREARRLVIIHRRIIQQVAELVLERKTLEGPEVDTLVAESQTTRGLNIP